MRSTLTSKYKDDAVIAFDFPVMARTRKKLLMDECLKYLAIVTDYAKKTLGAEKGLYNYSTSFGAYVTLRFLLEKKAIPLPALPYVRQLSRLMKA